MVVNFSGEEEKCTQRKSWLRLWPTFCNQTQLYRRKDGHARGGLTIMAWASGRWVAMIDLPSLDRFSGKFFLFLFVLSLSSL